MKNIIEKLLLAGIYFDTPADQGTGTVTEPANAGNGGGADEGNDPQTVPVYELQKERKRAKAAEDRLAKLEKDAQERADAELSEIDKVKKEKAQLESRIEAAEKLAIKTAQDSLVTLASTEAGFAAPDAVAKFVNYEAFDSLEGDDLKTAIRAEVERVKSEGVLALKETGDQGSGGTPFPGLTTPSSNGGSPDNEGEQALTNYIASFLNNR